MSALLESTITWSPFVLGTANAIVMCYFGNNFVVSDLTAQGTWSGNSGDAVLGLSAATVAVQSVAVLEWFKYLLKRQTGAIKINASSANMNFSRVMYYFWWLMLCFYIVSIIFCALNIELVNNYGNLQVEIGGNNNDLLGGSYGNAVMGMDYATLGLAGLSLGVYIYGEFGTRTWNEPKPVVTEIHGA